MNIYKKFLQIISETDINQWRCVEHCYRNVYEKAPKCTEFSNFMFENDTIKIIFSFLEIGSCTINLEFEGKYISKEFKFLLPFTSRYMLAAKLHEIVRHVMTQYEKEDQIKKEQELCLLNQIWEKLKA